MFVATEFAQHWNWDSTSVLFVSKDRDKITKACKEYVEDCVSGYTGNVPYILHNDPWGMRWEWTWGDIHYTVTFKDEEDLDAPAVKE
jgi:hypothetical protein